MILLPLPILALLSFSLHHPIFASSTPHCPTAYHYSPLDNTPDVNCRCLDPPAAVSPPRSSVSPPPASVSLPPKPRKSVLFPLGRVNGIATVVILVITLLNIVVYNLRQLQETNAAEKLTVPSSSSLPSEQLCRRFSLAEILSATHNFDESLVIGQGGFGKVYKGVIDNGASTVAIKRLHSMSRQGAPEFWTEIAMLSKFRHSHLVSLIGYCDNYSEMILVYEYMVRGTIANHLHKIGKHSTNNDSLTWVQRLKICIGAARGLDYLHTGTGIRHRVIHRDVKTSNILLDENMEAKISDFGMSKIGPANQSCTHVSTNVRGTYGYVDPEYFLTRRLTRKSDVYAFGVVLFEVLCGRPAVDLRLREEQRGLADWAQQCIKEGTLDQIIDPSLRGQILSNCMSAFVQIANQCLHARPKKRPTMAEVVAWLEFILSLQEREHSSIVDEEIFNAGTIFDIHVNADSVVKREVVNAGSGKSGDEKINEIAPLVDEGGGQSSVKSAKKMSFTKKVRLFFSVTARAISEKVRRPPRNTRPEPTTNLPTTNKPSEPVGNDAKPSTSRNNKHNNNNNNNNGGNSALPNKDGGAVQLAPVAQRAVTKPVHGDAKPLKNRKINNNRDGNVELPDKGVVVVKEVVPSGQIVTPELKMFTFAELKIATMNFRPDMVLGEGGFGRVFKGWVDEKTYAPSKVGIGIPIAVKKFNPEGLQGFKEWQSEVQFLGTFRHPNLVKLLGYCCWEDKEFLLVYEFMEKGSLEKHLFKKRAEPLPWDTRIKIAIGAARGLYFLHTSEKQVIYRDFKSSNILLNGDFSAKLSDFGLAKLGPANDGSHVTTGVMGTYGYAAPEYIATGHLYPKSDVYSFGVVLLEILTGLRVLDVNRPSGKHNLVEWAKPFLSDRRKLERVMDPRLEHEYPTKGAFRSAVLIQNCLQSDPKNRPSTEEVLIALENISAIKMKPKENPEANGRHPTPQRQE